MKTSARLPLLLGLPALTAALVWRAPLRRDPTRDFTEHGFTRRRVPTPGGEMNVYEAGQGPPLVFLHGIGGGASAWYWSKVAPAFTGRHRVVVPDWVGWGLSDHPARFQGGEDYAAQLRALLADLGEPAVVVAQSLAAGWAAQVARDEPRRIAHLVLWTPSGGLDFGEDAFSPLARAVLSTLARVPGLNLTFYRLVFHRHSFIRSWFTSQGFLNPAGVDRDLIEGSLYSARRPGAAYSALPFLGGSLRYDLAPLLRDLNVPTVLVWGERERQVGLDVGVRLARTADLPLEIMPDVRATPELERPRESVALLERLGV